MTSDRRIHVIGSRPADYAPPPWHRDPMSRRLTPKEVSDLRRRIENLRDVGWRPFGEAHEGWQAAIGWALLALDDILEGRDR